MEPLDFIDISRRVLHLASRGPGRIEFLRAVSRLMLDFSGCDALELHANLGESRSRYRWQATRAPREVFKFEPLTGQAYAKSTSDQPAWWDKLIKDVLDRNVGPKSRNVTPHGSFWTSDAAADLALRDGKDALLAPPSLDVQSLAIIPFDVMPTVSGVLALLSARKQQFSAQNIEFFEALAQTIGLAIDDRRAQHALRERVKELTCLYAIAQILEIGDAPIPDILARVVTMLPPAWQFPEVLAARIHLDDAEFTTGDIARSIHRHQAAVVIDGKQRGFVEVGYLEDRPEFTEGAFLKEEEHLIAAIAREVSRFVQTSEARIEKERLAVQVRQADRLATIGQLAAGVAHEINEPLGGILGFAQLSRKVSGVPEPVLQDLDKIVQAALHAREIVRKLMLFARQSPPGRSWVRINDVVEASLALLTTRVAEHRVSVTRDLDPAGPKIFADAVQLHQVVVNLCVNGIQAMPRGGALTIRTRASADSILITVADTGTGIEPAVAQHIFDPFFTTKTPEQGTGLGLSVVQGIVSSHGGTIRFDTQPGTGTRFEVSLPIHANTDDHVGPANHE